MAIALNGGHIARAIEFYKTPNKYFVIGGTKPWQDETNPTPPEITDFRLVDVVGLKRVDPILNTHLVVKDESGTIQYRDQNWRIVEERIDTRVGPAGVTKDSKVVTLEDAGGFIKGARIRINNVYEGTIESVSGSSLTLDTPAPEDIPAYAPALGGALVDGAKYVYIECYLEYDRFPIVTYRQVGLCTGVVPDPTYANSDTLLSSLNDGVSKNQYESLGILEVLDNRVPSTRDINQKEKLSLIIEF